MAVVASQLWLASVRSRYPPYDLVSITFDCTYFASLLLICMKAYSMVKFTVSWHIVFNLASAVRGTCKPRRKVVK